MSQGNLQIGGILVLALSCIFWVSAPPRCISSFLMYTVNFRQPLQTLLGPIGTVRLALIKSKAQLNAGLDAPNEGSLFDEVYRLMDVGKPLEAWNALLAAKGDMRPTSLRSQYMDCVSRALHMLPPAVAQLAAQDIGDFVVALTQLKKAGLLPAPRLYEPVLRSVAARLADPLVTSQVKIQHIAHMLWAFGKLGPNAGALAADALSERLQQVISDKSIRVHHLSMAVWGLARMQHQHVVLDTIAERLSVDIGTLGCEPQSLANIVWAYAKLDIFHEPLMLTIIEKLSDPNFLWKLKAQEIANIAWGFAKLNCAHLPTMMTIKDRCLHPEQLPFKTQELANLAWAFATLGISDEPFFMWMAQFALDRRVIDKFAPQGVSNMMWAYATVNITHIPLFTAFAVRLRNADFVTSFHPIGLANVIWALATLNIRVTPVLRNIANCTQQPHTLHLIDPSSMTALLWGFARLNYEEKEWFETMADHCAQPAVMNSFDARVLSNVIWAMGTAGHRHELLLTRSEERALQLVPQMQTQGIANMLWACATLQFRPSKLLEALDPILRAPDKFFDNCLPQEAANVVWALASLPPYGTSLFSDISMQLLSSGLLTRFSGADIAQTAWGFATAQVRDAALTSALLQQVVQPTVLSTLDATEAAMVIWSLGHLNNVDPDAVLPLCDWLAHKDKCAALGGPQALNVLWALAKLRLHHRILLSQLAWHLEDPSVMAVLDLSDFALLCWAYASLHFHPSTLLQQVATRCAAIQPPVKSSDISTVLWGLTTLGHSENVLPLAIRCANYSAELSPRDLVSCALSMAIAGTVDDGIMSELLQALVVQDLNVIYPSRCESLRLLCMHITLNMADMPHSYQHVPQLKHLLNKCYDVVDQNELTSTLAVTNCLQEMGFNVLSNEKVDSTEQCQADVLLPDFHTVVEMDGGNRVVHTEDGWHLTGLAALKRHHLRQLGYHVVGIPMHEWERMVTAEQQRDFLRNRLDASKP